MGYGLQDGQLVASDEWVRRYDKAQLQQELQMLRQQQAHFDLAACEVEALLYKFAELESE